MKLNKLKDGQFFTFGEFDKKKSEPKMKTFYGFADVSTLFRYLHTDCYLHDINDTSVTVLSKEEVLSCFKEKIDKMEEEHKEIKND